MLFSVRPALRGAMTFTLNGGLLLVAAGFGWFNVVGFQCEAWAIQVPAEEFHVTWQVLLIKLEGFVIQVVLEDGAYVGVGWHGEFCGAGDALGDVERGEHFNGFRFQGGGCWPGESDYEVPVDGVDGGVNFEGVEGVSVLSCRGEFRFVDEHFLEGGFALDLPGEGVLDGDFVLEFRHWSGCSPLQVVHWLGLLDGFLSAGGVHDGARV